MKALLQDNDAVTNEIAGQAYVENFALKVFAGADDEDRAGQATPSVHHLTLSLPTLSSNSHRRSSLTELPCGRSWPLRHLSKLGNRSAKANWIQRYAVPQPNPSTWPDSISPFDQMDAKLKYARFKAASLSKAFKAGTPPQAGPPPSTHPSIPDPTFPSPLPSPPILPPAVDQTEQEESAARHLGSWSNAATPGLGEEDRRLEMDEIEEDEGDEKDVEHALGVVPVGGFGGRKRRDSSNLIVRFAQGQGEEEKDEAEPSLPSFPSPPHPPTTSEADEPSAPAFERSRTPSPSPTLRPIQPISPEKPHSIQISPLPPSDLPAPPQPPSFPSPQAVAPPPARKLSVPPPQAPPSPPPQAQAELSLGVIEKIQKHARWAISALNYEDADTARKELKEALRLLG